MSLEAGQKVCWQQTERHFSTKICRTKQEAWEASIQARSGTHPHSCWWKAVSAASAAQGPLRSPQDPMACGPRGCGKLWGAALAAKATLACVCVVRLCPAEGPSYSEPSSGDAQACAIEQVPDIQACSILRTFGNPKPSKVSLGSQPTHCHVALRCIVMGLPRWR